MSQPPSKPSQRGRVFLAVAILFLAVSTLFVVAVTQRVAGPRCSARTLLHVRRSEPTSEGESQARETLVVLVKSRLCLNAALRDARVSDLPVVTRQLDPVPWLEERVQVDFVSGSDILRVRIDGNDIHEVIFLVSAVTDAFLREIVNKELIDRSRRLDQVQALLKQKRQRLQSEREGLLPAESAEELRLAEEAALDYGKEIRRTEFARIDAQARLARLQAAGKADENGAKNGAKLEEEIATLREREKLLMEELKKQGEQISRLRKTMADLESRRETIAPLQATVQRLAAEAERLETELKAPPQVTLLDPAVAISGNPG